MVNSCTGATDSAIVVATAMVSVWSAVGACISRPSREHEARSRVLIPTIATVSYNFFEKRVTNEGYDMQY
jgi:hypothetical protein